MLPMQGLTENEARTRRKRGEGNDTGSRPSRSYWDIARANLFTFFNNILFAIGIALVALGQVNDALTSVGLGLVNAIIGTVQEINAKRKLDQIALLTRPTVTVIREGREKAIDPADLVKGDIVRVQSGDQIIDFPGPIELFRIDAGDQQVHLVGLTVSIDFHSHREVRRQRALTAFRQKTAFYDIAKFQGR